MAIKDYNSTAAGNTTISGIGIAGTSAVNNFDNAMRQQLADIANWTDGDTLASGSTTDLGSVEGMYVTISGTTTITSFGTLKSGMVKFLRFSGALTLTHNATSLIIPGGANFVTAAGDTAIVVSEGSGNWRVLTVARASNNWVDVASATTTDIGAVASENVRITGTTTITGLGTVAAGTFRRVRFAGALALTYNATSLILPGAVSVTTVAGDVAEFISEGSGNWRCVSYERNLPAIAFRAHRNGSSAGIASSTATALAPADTDLNVGSYYNTGTQRFVPPAGNYFLQANATFTAGLVAGDDVQVMIYKNGALEAQNIIRAVNTSSSSVYVGALVAANGTDYFEAYVQAGGAGSKTVSGSRTQTYFCGSVVK